MADFSTMLAQIFGQQEEEQNQPQRPRRGLFGATINPQVTAQLGRDFGGDAFGQMGRDFRAGFDRTATGLRQGLPRAVINAMDQSGVPGWSGIAQARSQADATAAGLQAPGQMPQMPGTPLSQALMPGNVNDVQAPAMPVVPAIMRRGLEPPSAMTRQQEAERQRIMEDEAWAAAMERVRATRQPDPTRLRSMRDRELEPYRSRAEWDRQRIERQQLNGGPPVSRRR